MLRSLRLRRARAHFGARARGVLLAHDVGNIQGFHLSGLVPRMAAARALERATLLAQQLSWNLEMSRTVRTSNPHYASYCTTARFL
jgi:hypothetical protein